jgi:hypothetical protein
MTSAQYKKRLAKIKARHQSREALNLSAVAIEAPDLLEGLFDPEDFRGWYYTLIDAGLSYEEILITPTVEVECQVCGYRSESISAHIRNEHSYTAKEYTKDFPEHFELRCEEMRMERLGLRHGREAKLLMPHWEPAWSYLYVLDRLHVYHKKGIPLNYANIADNEGGMAGHIRRLFGLWDEGLKAAGIDPKQIRLARKSKEYTKASLIKLLKKLNKQSPGKLELNYRNCRANRACINQSFIYFGSYEEALRVAKIDPLTKIMALGDSEMLVAREVLLKEADKWLEEEVPYDLKRVSKFIRRHENTIYGFYGNWLNFCLSIGVSHTRFFRSPSYENYDSPELLIQGLKDRCKAGLSMKCINIRVDNISLLTMAIKHFGGIGQAITAAGDLPKTPAMSHFRVFKQPEDVIAAIKRRYEIDPEHIHLSQHSGYDAHEDYRGISLTKWSIRYFGSYAEALKAAKVRLPKPPPNYGDPKVVIREMRRRERNGEGVKSADLSRSKEDGGNRGLYNAMLKLFGSMNGALDAAKIKNKRW